MLPENQEWLKAPLGLISSKEVRTMIFSAKANGDGVHGMIAGTTGSGKSELLLSMIAAMAIKYDPRIVNFVLVDFKGGAAFEPFKKLPHCVDIATNLRATPSSASSSPSRPRWTGAPSCWPTAAWATWWTTASA